MKLVHSSPLRCILCFYNVSLHAFDPNAVRAYDEGIFLGLRLQVPIQSLGDIVSYLRGGGRDGVDSLMKLP